VPLCRDHHQELHRHGNERAWWANLQITPLEVARELWAATLLRSEPPNDTAVVTKQCSTTLDPANGAERNSNGRPSP
jgi:hypothetical protein